MLSRIITIPPRTAIQSVFFISNFTSEAAGTALSASSSLPRWLAFSIPCTGCCFTKIQRPQHEECCYKCGGQVLICLPPTPCTFSLSKSCQFMKHNSKALRSSMSRRPKGLVRPVSKEKHVCWRNCYIMKTNPVGGC